MSASCTLTRTASTCDLRRMRPVGMLSRSASSTRSSSHMVFTPCFPSAEGSSSLAETRSLPIRPRKKAVFDVNSCSVPIREFDDQTHSTYSAPRQDGVDADLPTAQPESFSDEYLMPSLTRNERLRLTMREYCIYMSSSADSFPKLVIDALGAAQQNSNAHQSGITPTDYSRMQTF